MDKIANRPKGFAFVQYATEEESQKAIEGMHGKVWITFKYELFTYLIRYLNYVEYTYFSHHLCNLSIMDTE